ncbi:uncharacterized protein Bfra_003969 [Botrytis fragariae]|uniref:Uncharacterized protein n=1 Tax=Botrytis fragariae TaxID=1964551 RepID=A0A8H6AY15_9HELO|nr:uncharacterized protein Bfra_003969 [Botrytis fragariae]KAF5875515.1 hypothetical protein Bfra_003969 [Botrytis fragariae]
MATYSLDPTEQPIADVMNPESSSMAIVSYSIILSSLQIVFVTARFLSRLLRKVPSIWGLNDHLIIVRGTIAVISKHAIHSHPPQLRILKLAILFLYKRLFIISKRAKHAIRGATYAAYAFIIVLEAIAILQRVPRSDTYKTGPRKSHHIVTDILIFLIPVPVEWKLNVPLGAKMESAWYGNLRSSTLGILADTAPARSYICERRITTLATNSTCCLFNLRVFAALPPVT